MKKNIAAMIGSTFFIFSFVFLHPVIVPNGIAAERDQKKIQQVTLKIDGMDCGACAKDIRSALLKTPGVQAAEVKTSKRWVVFNDYSNVRAVVEFEQGKTTVDDLIKAVEGASNSIFTYKARLAE